MADRAEETEIKRMSDEEKRRFETEHKLLSVYLVNNAKQYVISPQFIVSVIYSTTGQQESGES